MKTRLIVATIMAGSVAAAAAQDPPSRPDQKAGAQARTVTVTGCLEQATAGADTARAQQAPGSTAHFILAQAKVTSDPNAPTGTSGTTGSLTSADRFRLIAEKQAEMKNHVSHRVEITGTLQPRSEQGQAKGGATSQKPSAEADLPTLRVTGFKHIAATCGPDAQ